MTRLLTRLVVAVLTLVIAARVSAAAQQAPPQPPEPTAAESALADQIAAAPSAAERRRVMDASGAALTAGVQRALSARAMDLRKAARLDDSAKMYGVVREVAEHRNDRAGLALSLVLYSAIPGMRAEYPAALQVLHEALGIGEALENNEVIGAALAKWTRCSSRSAISARSTSPGARGRTTT